MTFKIQFDQCLLNDFMQAELEYELKECILEWEEEKDAQISGILRQPPGKIYRLSLRTKPFSL